MFDRSFLPSALCEFIVMADTHYMIDPAGQSVEFGSRRHQSARTEHALQLVAALTADLATPQVIHMGDLIQEFPERPAFAQARDEALDQLARHGVQPRLVAGNHDMGDKPDPTMPAITSATITLDEIGPSFTHQIGLLTGYRQPCTTHSASDITEPLLFCGTI